MVDNQREKQVEDNKCNNEEQNVAVLYTIQKDEDKNLNCRSYSLSLVIEGQNWCFNELPGAEIIKSDQTPTIL